MYYLDKQLAEKGITTVTISTGTGRALSYRITTDGILYKATCLGKVSLLAKTYFALGVSPTSMITEALMTYYSTMAEYYETDDTPGVTNIDEYGLYSIPLRYDTKTDTGVFMYVHLGDSIDETSSNFNKTFTPIILEHTALEWGLHVFHKKGLFFNIQRALPEIHTRLTSALSDGLACSDSKDRLKLEENTCSYKMEWVQYYLNNQEVTALEGQVNELLLFNESETLRYMQLAAEYSKMSTQYIFDKQNKNILLLNYGFNGGIGDQRNPHHFIVDLTQQNLCCELADPYEVLTQSGSVEIRGLENHINRLLDHGLTELQALQKTQISLYKTLKLGSIAKVTFTAEGFIRLLERTKNLLLDILYRSPDWDLDIKIGFAYDDFMEHLQEIIPKLFEYKDPNSFITLIEGEEAERSSEGTSLLVELTAGDTDNLLKEEPVRVLVHIDEDIRIDWNKRRKVHLTGRLYTIHNEKNEEAVVPTTEVRLDYDLSKWQINKLGKRIEECKIAAEKALEQYDIY